MSKESVGKKAKVAATVRIRWARRNRILLWSGLGAVIFGYLLLSQGDITAAPVLLVAGYCVLIPLAFIL